MKMCPLLIRCSPSNKRTLFHLRVNLKSKIHPSRLRGKASSWAELCIDANNPPTCCNEANKIDTGWYTCTSTKGTKQKHFVQAAMYAYSITNQLVPYTVWQTQTYISHWLYGKTDFQHPSIISRQTLHTHATQSQDKHICLAHKFLDFCLQTHNPQHKADFSAPDGNNRCLNWRQKPVNNQGERKPNSAGTGEKTSAQRINHLKFVSMC